MENITSTEALAAISDENLVSCMGSEPFDVNAWLLQTLANVLKQEGMGDQSTLDGVRAAVECMQPGDITESMLCSQMIAAHTCIMKQFTHMVADTKECVDGKQVISAVRLLNHFNKILQLLIKYRKEKNRTNIKASDKKPVSDRGIKQEMGSSELKLQSIASPIQSLPASHITAWPNMIQQDHNVGSMQDNKKWKKVEKMIQDTLVTRKRTPQQTELLTTALSSLCRVI